MGAYLQMLKIGKRHQVHRVANRNMCHHWFVPPPVAYDSWGMLMTSILHVSATSLPKPGLSINYGQDEIRVPIRQPFISRSQGDPAQRKFAFHFFLSLSEQEQGMQRDERKWISSRDEQTVNNKEEIHLERKCKVIARERRTTVGLSIFPSPVAS